MCVEAYTVFVCPEPLALTPGNKLTLLLNALSSCFCDLSCTSCPQTFTSTCRKETYVLFIYVWASSGHKETIHNLLGPDVAHHFVPPCRAGTYFRPDEPHRNVQTLLLYNTKWWRAVWTFNEGICKVHVR